MKKLASTTVLIMLFLSISLISAPVKVHAEVAKDCDGSTSFLGFPTWYKYLDIGPRVISGNKKDPCAIIGPTEDGKPIEVSKFSFPKAIPLIGLAMVDILLRIAGMVTVGYIIYGGFRYMTSQGDPEALKNAQGTIINALIGLAVAVLAVGIVSFVGGRL